MLGVGLENLKYCYELRFSASIPYSLIAIKTFAYSHCEFSLISSVNLPRIKENCILEVSKVLSLRKTDFSSFPRRL